MKLPRSPRPPAGYASAHVGATLRSARRSSTQTMALEELPHDSSRVDFLLRPRVAEAIDANHPDLGVSVASLIAHGGKWTRRIIDDCAPVARVVACPPCESVGN